MPLVTTFEWNDPLEGSGAIVVLCSSHAPKLGSWRAWRREALATASCIYALAMGSAPARLFSDCFSIMAYFVISDVLPRCWAHSSLRLPHSLRKFHLQITELSYET